MRYRRRVKLRAVSLKSRVRVRRRNEERLARRRARAFGPKAEWVRSLPCATCRTGHPPSDPSHVRSRGADGDARHLIPQCHRCHARMHQAGRGTFARECGYDLDALAMHYELRWRALPEGRRGLFMDQFRARWPDAARIYDEEAEGATPEAEQR